MYRAMDKQGEGVLSLEEIRVAVAGFPGFRPPEHVKFLIEEEGAEVRAPEVRLLRVGGACG